MDKPLKIIVIPDPQIKEESNLSHLTAAGNYILEEQPDVVVAIGDWCDMPSLSRHASMLEIEGKRVAKDIEAGKEGVRKLLSAVNAYNDVKRAGKHKTYNPRFVFTTGNHCPAVRIQRLISEMPVLEGYVKDDFELFLKENKWEVHPFLEVVNIGGVNFSHYFINPHSAKKMPLSGTIDNMIKSAGFSFVQGHRQGLQMGKHYLGDGSVRIGIVAGSFYQEDEAFMGPQGNRAHWRGIIKLDDVKNGSADITEMSLGRLMREWG